jgi:hypothetical protein
MVNEEDLEGSVIAYFEMPSGHSPVDTKEENVKKMS